MRTQYLDISMQRINTLHPKLISSAMRVMDKCADLRIPVYIIWGKRSIEEQDLLYRMGRTIPGKIVTMRKGGWSPHNYGLALDFCLLFNKELLSWEECYPRDYWKKKWLRAVQLFEGEGWISKWRGIDFEPGHVENLLEFNLKTLYEQTDFGNNWK